MRFTQGCVHHFTQAQVLSPCSFILVYSPVTNKLLLGTRGKAIKHTQRKEVLQNTITMGSLDIWGVLFVKCFLHDLTKVCRCMGRAVHCGFN